MKKSYLHPKLRLLPLGLILAAIAILCALIWGCKKDDPPVKTWADVKSITLKTLTIQALSEPRDTIWVKVNGPQVNPIYFGPHPGILPLMIDLNDFQIAPNDYFSISIYDCAETTFPCWLSASSYSTIPDEELLTVSEIWHFENPFGFVFDVNVAYEF